ncbi:PAAR domain-containing protein [Vibrio ostreae]|uniref:PAAR domain-containing protein n=1 Tax=Vibrio ostreae TaxID=2841925 RepID=A0A975U6X8_9VIBR|nr:PAAR domain-containing protein [Vibrio ostreae]QXO16300.1 PAAR domain-containing protein [Vibrio ostreae]
MPGAARLGDTAGGHGCFPPTSIIAGSPDVLINGKPAARKGDAALLHACPCPYKPHGLHGRAINAGSGSVSINGQPAARIGDAIDCGGSVASGSGDVIIGDTPYQSNTHACGEGAVLGQSPFLKITPLAKNVEALWNSPTFTPQALAALAGSQAMSTAADIAAEKAVSTLPPLAQSLVKVVQSGASKLQMLDVLETGTTKAQRREARKTITQAASANDPQTAQRFSMDMDAAEKAMLADHVYTLDKERNTLEPHRKQVAEDFDNDSGWSVATEDDLAELGIQQKDLKVKGTNFRSQVYIPDPEVFGENAKPTLVFRGTEMDSGSDWIKGNLSQGAVGRSSYYKQAVKTVLNIQDQGVDIEIAGHSLGGGLASAASKASGYPATTFNAAGLHRNTVANYGVASEMQSADSLVTGYRVDGEVLTRVQEKTPVLRRLAPSAVRNGELETTLPKSTFMPDVSTGTTEDKRGSVALHGMDQMRESIEERKVGDLHKLASEA